jgi:hypothetical protein
MTGQHNDPLGTAPVEACVVTLESAGDGWGRWSLQAGMNLVLKTQRERQAVASLDNCGSWAVCRRLRMWKKHASDAKLDKQRYLIFQKGSKTISKENHERNWKACVCDVNIARHKPHSDVELGACGQSDDQQARRGVTPKEPSSGLSKPGAPTALRPKRVRSGEGRMCHRSLERDTSARDEVDDSEDLQKTQP